MTTRHKASVKCECGKVVSPGSVFCPSCRSVINKKNLKVIKREEDRYQKKIKNRGKRKK